MIEKDKRMVFRCDEDVLNKLEIISKENRRTKSDMIRELVHKEYNRKKRKNK